MRSTIAGAMVFAFALSLLQPALSYASTQSQPVVEIKVKVSEKGFLDEKGKPFGPQHALKLPHGQKVTITFVFSEEMNSLAIGDTHQIAIVSEDSWSQETEKIWVFNRKASVTFLAGEKGRTKYRAYCILDCLGMEHLNNLIIKVA